MSKTYNNFQKLAISIHQCTVKNCTEIKNINELQQIRILYRNFTRSNNIVEQDKTKKISNHFIIKFSLKRKQIRLCLEHAKK